MSAADHARLAARQAAVARAGVRRAVGETSRSRAVTPVIRAVLTTVMSVTATVTARNAEPQYQVRLTGRARIGTALPRAMSAEIVEAATIATRMMMIWLRLEDHCTQASAAVGSGRAETSMGISPPARLPRISGMNVAVTGARTAKNSANPASTHVAQEARRTRNWRASRVIGIPPGRWRRRRRDAPRW